MPKFEKEIKILNHVGEIINYSETNAESKKCVSHINMHFNIGNITTKLRIYVPSSNNDQEYKFSIITKNKILPLKAKYPIKKEIETKLSIDEFEGLLKILPIHFKDKGITYYHVNKTRYTNFHNISFVDDFTIDLCQFITNLPEGIYDSIDTNVYPNIINMLNHTQNMSMKMIHSNQYIETETLSKGISTDDFVKKLLKEFKKSDIPTKDMKLTAKGICGIVTSNLNKYNKINNKEVPHDKKDKTHIKTNSVKMKDIKKEKKKG